MDGNGVNGLSELESSASQSASLLELWHGGSQSVRDRAGKRGPSARTGRERSEFGATLTRMVLWGHRQEGQASTRTGSQHLFCPATALDSELVADSGDPSGAGARCDDVEET